MSLLLKTAIRLHGQRAALRLDKETQAPREAQQQFLLRALQHNAQTSFGRRHNFAQIRSVADYRQRVPVRDYEDFRPLVNRVMAGEPLVLTKEQPFMLTMTSGTTGEQKFIPVTRRSQQAEASLMRQWLYRALLAHPAYMDGRSVAIVSRAIEGQTPSGLPYGSASGVTYKNVPRLIRRTQAIPYNVSEIEDYDQRYFLIARFALASEISFIITPNPSTLLRLAALISVRSEGLLRAIHDGTLGITPLAPESACAQLSKRLRPDPQRARRLSRIIASQGALRPVDCWPKLKLIACWIGGSVGTQARRLADDYGHAPLRDLGYIASEGRFTVTAEDNTPDGILAVGSNFYEFIPEQETDSARPTILLSHELEQDRRYSILLTTLGGLYRYRIQDIIEVNGFYNRTPLINFVRKEGETASITGEKLHVNHLTLALNEVRQSSRLDIRQFRAAPDYAGNCYQVYLEINGRVSHAVLKNEVLPLIDTALARVNIEYAQKRASKRLGPPRLHLMRAGWSSEISRRQIIAGKRDTQYKWPLLCPEPQAEDTPFILNTIEAVDERARAAGFSAAA